MGRFLMIFLVRLWESRILDLQTGPKVLIQAILAEWTSRLFVVWVFRRPFLKFFQKLTFCNSSKLQIDFSERRFCQFYEFRFWNIHESDDKRLFSGNKRQNVYIIIYFIIFRERLFIITRYKLHALCNFAFLLFLFYKPKNSRSQ